VGKFELYGDEAKCLYVEQSKTLEEISQILDVSIPTLSKWKINGEWDKARQEHRRRKLSTEDRLKKILEDKLTELESKKSADIDSKEIDQISKISAAIEKLRTRRDPLGATLMVMEEFISWLQQKDQDIYNSISQYFPEFFQYMRNKNEQ
jgi:transposase-like protein